MDYMDLMIGNWVYYKGEPCKIFEIGLKARLENYNMDYAHYDDLKPVPIGASNFLRKRGFDILVHDDEGDTFLTCSKGDIELFNLPSESNFYFMDIKGIGLSEFKVQHYHQVQNAYRTLTGKEI